VKALESDYGCLAGAACLAHRHAPASADRTRDRRTERRANGV